MGATRNLCATPDGTAVGVQIARMRRQRRHAQKKAERASAHRLIVAVAAAAALLLGAAAACGSAPMAAPHALPARR